jgi:hypothetical protein
MDHIEMGDFYIIRLIEVARTLLREYRQWLDRYGGLPYNEAPPMPEFYKNYLGVKRTITAAMKWRRQHRKNVSEIWRAYADSVVKKLQEQEKNNAGRRNEKSE